MQISNHFEDNESEREAEGRMRKMDTCILTVELVNADVFIQIFKSHLLYFIFLLKVLYSGKLVEYNVMKSHEHKYACS